ncbi:MAG: DUF4917 family protein [Sphingomonadaceae bacterium]|nr:DUF4917 family protein [Sphingomonadaceae bacterium]
MEYVSFDEALQRSDAAKRHLLLGNGFSIALFPGRFAYKSLLQEAKDSGLFETSPQLSAAFEILDTSDFEEVISALKKMEALIPLYADVPEVAAKMAADADALKNILVEAIAGKHPERPSDIGEEQYQACREFLKHFVGDIRGRPARQTDLRGCIYTLNYDLLLYWTLLHTGHFETTGPDVFDFQLVMNDDLKHDDGFRAPDGNFDAPYVAWSVEDGSNKQNIHFLHGGLHLFDRGAELEKRCWERAGQIPLMDQIRAALDEERFPLFVSEGDSDSKLEKILHSGYLTRSYKSFAGICSVQNCALFLFGHSLAQSDDHILRMITKGKTRHLFVSFYGDAEEERNQAIRSRLEQMIEGRGEYAPLSVAMFNADSAHVWA